ncbi:MAG: lysylphosphatidylglycerol synthase transmembrane domain-containing protein [Verrucomicrobiota bacterium]
MSDMVEEKRPRKINWGLWIKLIIVAAILAVIFWVVEWDQFWKEISNVDVRWYVAAFCSFGLALAAGAYRWQQLLRVQGIQLPFRESWVLTMIGFCFNQFMPGSTGGDLVKIFYAIRKAPEKKPATILSIGMDRVLGLVAILAITFILLPFEWTKLSADTQTRAIVIVLLVALSAVFGGLLFIFLCPVRVAISLFSLPMKVLPERLRQLWAKGVEVIESLYQAMHAHGKEWGYTLRAILGAVITVIPLLSVGWLLAQALNLDIGPGAMVILFAMVLCCMSVPLVPGGHGTRDGAFILLFGVFAVTRDEVAVGKEVALAASILFLFINWFWAMIGGAVYFLFSSHIKKTEPNL